MTWVMTRMAKMSQILVYATIVALVRILYGNKEICPILWSELIKCVRISYVELSNVSTREVYEVCRGVEFLSQVSCERTDVCSR